MDRSGLSPSGPGNRHDGLGAWWTTGTWVSWLWRMGSPRRSCQQTEVTGEALLPGSQGASFHHVLTWGKGPGSSLQSLTRAQIHSRGLHSPDPMTVGDSNFRLQHRCYYQRGHRAPIQGEGSWGAHPEGLWKCLHQPVPSSRRLPTLSWRHHTGRSRGEEGRLY